MKGGDPSENAKELRVVLSPGDFTNAKRDSIVLNAGMGLYVYGKTNSIKEGVSFARNVLNSGKAIETLDKWIDTTKNLAKDS